MPKRGSSGKPKIHHHCNVWNEAKWFRDIDGDNETMRRANIIAQRYLSTAGRTKQPYERQISCVNMRFQQSRFSPYDALGTTKRSGRHQFLCDACNTTWQPSQGGRKVAPRLLVRHYSVKPFLWGWGLTQRVHNTAGAVSVPASRVPWRSNTVHGRRRARMEREPEAIPVLEGIMHRGGGAKTGRNVSNLQTSKR